MNTSHISNIENNRVKVSLSTLVQICNALDTTVDYILSDEYKDPDSPIEQAILHEIHGCSLETKKQILKVETNIIHSVNLNDHKIPFSGK